MELAKCEGTLCGEVEPQRTTEGVEPCAVKAASTVLNGGDEETGQKALRLVPTQRRLPPASAALPLPAAAEGWR